MTNEELMSMGYLPQSGGAEQAAMLAVANARKRQAPTMRSEWSGPLPDRPVVDGRKMVSAEELADFRRQFGFDKTLRDLLNADRGLVPAAVGPSRGVRAEGVNYLPGAPGVIPGGGAGPAAQGRMPGEVERNLMNALMALGPMLGGMRAMPQARNALAAPVSPEAVPVAQVMRNARTGLPMRPPMPAEVYLQGSPTMMRTIARPMPGASR